MQPPQDPARAEVLRERGDSATATTDFFGTRSAPTASRTDDANPAERAFRDHDLAADVVELAEFYRYLADAEFAGYCDLYATLARAIAEDAALLERIGTLAPGAKIIPVLLFAAVHDHLLAEPNLPLAQIYRGGPGDPVPLFKELVLTHFDALQAVVARRTIQTNEVGRSAVLLPALTAAHRRVGRPLAIVEIGPSAGLNLFFDRYAYEYTRANQRPGTGPSTGPGTGPTDANVPVFARAGVPGSTVQLRCEVRGELAPPLDAAPPPVHSRQGIDLNPIDVRDETDCRWLEACIWPLVPLRAERFRAAVALARQDPPNLHRGAALELLPAVLDAIPDDIVPVVVSTWVLAYFSKEQRTELGELLDAAGARRDLVAISAEYPSVAPWVPRPDRGAIDDAAQGATNMGWLCWHAGRRDVRALAWTQAHGRWIDWLDAETGTPLSRAAC